MALDSINQGNGAPRDETGIGSPQDISSALAAALATLAQMEGLLASARQRVASLEEAGTAASAALEVIKSKSDEASAVATVATAAKTKIADEQAVIATKSDHIQDAQDHADKVRKELDRVQTAMTQAATLAEGLRDRAQSAADSTTELLTEVRTSKASAESELATIVAARDAAKLAGEATKKLADMAENIELRIEKYQIRLAELDEKSSAQLAEITRLLPGATAAGLAHSFDERRQTFLKPASQWQRIFVGSIAALVLLALSGLWGVFSNGTPLTYDELVRLWIARLPIAGALIWLALHSSREAALARRLEEDYGYKAAVAASFQGFQKQMADIGAASPAGSPLTKLCEDTLATIASPPGRIYDKHQLTVTPSSEIAAAASKVANAGKPSQS